MKISQNDLNNSENLLNYSIENENHNYLGRKKKNVKNINLMVKLVPEERNPKENLNVNILLGPEEIKDYDGWYICFIFLWSFIFPLIGWIYFFYNYSKFKRKTFLTVLAFILLINGIMLQMKNLNNR